MNAPAISSGRLQGIGKYLWRHKYLYLLLLPCLAYYFIFCYAPMYGAVIAFKDFSYRKGILGSPWAGMKHFRMLFSGEFVRVIWNTLRISFIRLIFGFPFPIFISILLNEVRSTRFKRSVQTFVYLPHFISWVVISGLLTNLLSVDNGIINVVIKSMGFSPIPFLNSKQYFVGTMVVSMIWKTFGWNTIIYLAALTAVDPQLYESAIIDGANRWHRIRYITLPSIASTITIVLILRLGQIMEAGFEQIFVLYHPAVYSVSDIIDTFVYRVGLSEARFEIATAAGLFKSVINLALLVSANAFARRFADSSIF